MKLTILQQEIFTLLCKKTGEKINQRQIAKLLRATPTGVAQALQEMERSDIAKIEKSKTMNLNLVSLHRTQEVLGLKRIENLSQIQHTGLAVFLEEQFPGTTIILFGSYSRGEDTTTSDIDIALIGGKEKAVDLVHFERHLERKININYYDSMRSINKELRENLCNGIVLAGAIEL
jgi:predicted nucleotidyltransferase